jgi:hypothetical protein
MYAHAGNYGQNMGATNNEHHFYSQNMASDYQSIASRKDYASISNSLSLQFR